MKVAIIPALHPVSVLFKYKRKGADATAHPGQLITSAGNGVAVMPPVGRFQDRPAKKSPQPGRKLGAKTYLCPAKKPPT